jgi:hypothetical protein
VFVVVIEGLGGVMMSEAQGGKEVFYTEESMFVTSDTELECRRRCTGWSDEVLKKVRESALGIYLLTALACSICS